MKKQRGGAEREGEREREKNASSTWLNSAAEASFIGQTSRSLIAWLGTMGNGKDGGPVASTLEDAGGRVFPEKDPGYRIISA